MQTGRLTPRGPKYHRTHEQPDKRKQQHERLHVDGDGGELPGDGGGSRIE